MNRYRPVEEPAAPQDEQPLARQQRLAEAVRQACLETARSRFEMASTDGLCAEGALEVALDAIRSLDLDRIVEGLE